MKLSNVTLFMLLGRTSLVYAQQFVAAKQSYDVMGLSDECTKVLNTELKACHSRLFDRTDRTIDNVVDRLPRKELDLICKPKCRDELSALRKKIVETCTSPEDVMRNSGFEFPAYFFADKFAYTFDLNCYKHKSSGRFCDEVYIDWRDGKVEFDECDDCYLGPLALQLASPIGVSVDIAALFNSTIASCKDSDYNVEIATPYAKLAVSQTIAGAAASQTPRTCDRSYTVKKGDTCNSIAVAQNVSTFGLVQMNAMNINCEVMPDKGTNLCLDRPCDTYTIRAGEDCASISETFGLSENQFIALNPMIDSTCSNIKRWKNYVVCVGPESLIAAREASEETQESMPVPKAPRKPLAPGSSDKCTTFVNGRALTDPDFVARWKGFSNMVTPETVLRHNKCVTVTGANGVDAKAFRKMNPSLVEGKPPGTKCILDGRYSYCLAEEGGPQPNLPEGWKRERGWRWG
ncbi:hypothetical protein ACHAQH_008838 [Verticillium albo-atrum]